MGDWSALIVSFYVLIYLYQSGTWVFSILRFELKSKATIFILLLKLFQLKTIESFFFSWFLWPFDTFPLLFIYFLSTVLYFGMKPNNSSCIFHDSIFPLFNWEKFSELSPCESFSLEIRNSLRCWMGFRMTVIPIAQLAPWRIILIFSLAEIGGFLEWKYE